MFEIWKKIIPTLEILILWIVFYRILIFFQGSRAFQVLKGISYLLLAFAIFQILGLVTLNWLLTKFFAISIIALVIIFQQELRQGLARLGQGRLFSFGLGETEIMAVIEQISEAAFKMSKQKVGSIMAIERQIKLDTYIESGISLDGKISAELLQTIFTPPGPLHDGGVVCRGDRVAAASCLFPLSDNPNFSKLIGTRHRAALGLTEQTDALVVLVSEETAEISVASDGRFIPVMNQERLIGILKSILVPQDKQKNAKPVSA